MTYIVKLLYKKSEKENFEMEFETAEPLKQFLINLSDKFIDVDLDGGCGKIDDETFVGLAITNKEEEEIKEENNQ